MTMADPDASGKTNRFVGICIQRGGKGLGATFVLRNIIDNQGQRHVLHFTFRCTAEAVNDFCLWVTQAWKSAMNCIVLVFRRSRC